MNKIHIRLTEANELYCSCMLMLSTEMWPFFLFDQLYLLKIPFNLSEIFDRKQLLTSSVNPDSPQSDSQHSYTNAELLVDSRTQWWWCTVYRGSMYKTRWPHRIEIIIFSIFKEYEKAESDSVYSLNKLSQLWICGD